MPAPARGRPRVVGTDQRVIDTVLDLLGEGATLHGLSFVAVAARAGISRNTIYRRWPTKDLLLLDVLATVTPPWPEPSEGDTRGQLIDLVETLYERGRDPRAGRLVRCLIAEADQFPDLRQRYTERIVRPRRHALRQLLEHGIQRHNIRPDLDLDTAVLVLSGAPLFYGLSDTAADLLDAVTPRELATRLVDLVLAGLARPAEHSSPTS